MAISGSDGSIILTTKVDESGIKNFGKNAKTSTKNIGESFKKLGQVIATAFAVKKIYEFGKAIVSAYADYEQLVGGVETLFGESSKKMLEYANQAYKTAGLSANAYMETATSFSASLLSSLGGDTEKAADYANRAIIDMSDNANKMGTSMEMIQNAYQGFAKQNYTMLDNLKLGYGGTKTEMERLVRDASQLKDVQAELGVTVDANSSSFGNIVNAISVMQKQMGIAGTTTAEAEKTITGSLNMVKASWQNLLTAASGGGNLDSAIQNLVYSLEKYLDNLIPVIERALVGIGYAIERIAPMLVERVAKALIQAMPSLLAAVYQMIIGLAKGIYQGIIALFKGEATEAVETQAETIASATENQNALTEAVEETAEAQKKSLAGFDEINILASETADSQEETSNLTASNISGGTADTSTFGTLKTQISDDLAEIMGYAGAALCAIGLILLLLGNFAWGIGFIIAGAASLAVSIATIGENKTKEEAQSMLLDIMLIAGSALLALGIILLLVGQITPLSIGLVVAGAATLAGAIAINPSAVGKKIKKFFQDNAWIMAGVSLVLLIIGIILCFAKIYPLGIGLIAAGAVSLGATVALNWKAIVDNIKKFVFKNSTLIALISGGLIILGILLCFVVLPLGLSLIAAGAVGLVAVVAVKWNTIKEKVSSAFKAVITWVKTYGLLVIGIILCLTGVGIPLGIALIVKWAKDGVKNGVPLANVIVDKVKQVWKAVQQFWNTHIAPIFTTKWWANLGKNIINGLISGIETGINWIIDALNGFIGGISSITEAIGGLIGQDWEIPEIGHIQIPRLAKGAVIPPNREFLAVLGDQKQGTNIEAPLQTIVDAFNIALAQNGGYSGGNTEVILEIDGREFGRAVVEQGNRENRRIGTRLVIA